MCPVDLAVHNQFRCSIDKHLFQRIDDSVLLLNRVSVSQKEWMVRNIADIDVGKKGGVDASSGVNQRNTKRPLKSRSRNDENSVGDPALRVLTIFDMDRLNQRDEAGGRGRRKTEAGVGRRDETERRRRRRKLQTREQGRRKPRPRKHRSESSAK